MTTASTDLFAKPPSPYSVFRHRDFRLMWTGQFVSTAGTALTSLAASILVYRLTGSALSVGLMMIATAAPSLLVGLFAGVIVDRYDRKRIMIVTELLRAVLIALIPFLVTQNIAWLYVIVALTSAIAQFYDPAHESVLPEVAPEKELAAANSLMSISSFGSTAIGFAASGLIASAANIDWAFYLDAVSFLVSALCILFVNVQPLGAEEDASAAMIMRNLRVGLRFLADTPVLRSLFLVYIPVLISYGLSNSLLLPFADRALGATEFQYGIQEALTSVAFVACSLLIAGIFDRMREGQWIALSWIVMGLLTMVYAMLTSIPLAMLVIALTGFANPPSAVGGRLILQRNTPREMRGRVNSAYFVLRDIVFLVGMGLAGLADFIDVRVMFLISGVILLAGGLLVLVLPGLRDDAAAWKRSMALLRGAPAAPRLGAGRAALATDADTLVNLIPTLCNLTPRERDVLTAHAVIIPVPTGTAIVRRGEKSDKAYFVMAGRTVAGFEDTDGSFRVLNPLLAGDFFGEIAALTGSARTADVVADEDTQLMQVPAATLREMMSNPQFSSLVLETMTSRLSVVSSTVLPRFAALDQSDLRDLRTNAPEE